MQRSNSKFFTGLVVGAIVLIALNVFWLHWFRPHASAGSGWAARLFHSSSHVQVWLSEIAHWRTLADENSNLKTQLAAAAAVDANVEQLQHQNDQLRAAAGLSDDMKETALPGGIYDVNLAPDGYTASVNKGSRQGVAMGDAVVGPNEVLVGTVQAVFADSARVILISDPSFKVTTQVLGGQTKGIAQGALTDGMSLDLVVQSDTINEGDTLVTSGDDTLPGGLVVGTVSHVDSNTAKLFKQVSIAPAAQFLTGDVFILLK